MTVKRMTTTAVAALMLATVPGVAMAQETTTTEPITQTQDRDTTALERGADWIERIRARALEAIEKRLTTIDELEVAIARSETIHPGHAGQLQGELRGSAAGLESLAGKIRAADDFDTLRALVPKIFEDYRIYAIVAPKVHLVLASDAAGAVADRLTAAGSSLGDVLDRLEAHGLDMAEARVLLAEMQRLTLSGGDWAASVPPMVLGLTPADYPGSNETLREAQAVAKSAGTDLRSAGNNAHEIVRLILEALAGGDTD